MSVLLAHISDSLLLQLQGKSDQEKWEACTKDFPWYPMPWLALAKNGDEVSAQKAAVWVEDEQRLHFLLNTNSFSQDVWLLKNFNTAEENTAPATVFSEKGVAATLNPTDIFLTEPEQVLQPPAAIVTREEKSSPPKFTLTGKFDQEDETAEEEDANDTDFVEPENDTSPITVHFNPHTDHQFLEKNIQPATEVQATEAVVESKVVEPSTNTTDAPKPTAPPIIAELKEQTETTSAATDQSKPIAEPLAFEPYHVVDYFASQGIKVDINDLPKTQLDRQMKSFTQWLKTMKKVAPAQESNAATDPIVDAQATSSLIKEDVITEAMAEVLEKQGMDKKAIEVYEKLMLLYPEKSTFFAARIKDLKSK